jgi:hypothetical protein
MSDSADRRALRKAAAEASRHLPTREALQAAAQLEQLEQTRMQRATQSAQLALQNGSLAVAVLSQIPRDNEENKPLFMAARKLLGEVLVRAIDLVRSLANPTKTTRTTRKVSDITG